MTGETVRVRTYQTVGADPYGAPITEPTEAEVPDVLVAPGPQADLGEERPEGVEVRYTLYLPKAFSGDLEGAEIEVRGEWLAVVGHPAPFDDAVCPTRWHMACEVGGTHG